MSHKKIFHVFQFCLIAQNLSKVEFEKRQIVKVQ